MTNEVKEGLLDNKKLKIITDEFSKILMRYFEISVYIIFLTIIDKIQKQLSNEKIDKFYINIDRPNSLRDNPSIDFNFIITKNINENNYFLNIANNSFQILGMIQEDLKCILIDEIITTGLDQEDWGGDYIIRAITMNTKFDLGNGYFVDEIEHKEIIIDNTFIKIYKNDDDEGITTSLHKNSFTELMKNPHLLYNGNEDTEFVINYYIKLTYNEILNDFILDKVLNLKLDYFHNKGLTIRI